MPYRQAEETLSFNALKTPRVLPIWIFPKDSPLKNISSKEEQTANSLPPLRSREYKHSRGYVRFALSKFFNLHPLEIPLEALPGEAPKLGNDLGYISFSHCSDALLIAWSSEKIGVDIEKRNRAFNAIPIANRFFNQSDTEGLKSLSDDKLHMNVLKQWVTKEALIKWQRGKLVKDLQLWITTSNTKIAFHETLKAHVHFYSLMHKHWVIAIACNQQLINEDLIICEA